MVFPNTTAQQAFQILSEVHAKFSAIHYDTPLGQFNCTFSGGIAQLEDFEEELTLSKAADDALYQAKHQGRNQLVIAKLDMMPKAGKK